MNRRSLRKLGYFSNWLDFNSAHFDLIGRGWPQGSISIDPSIGIVVGTASVILFYGKSSLSTNEFFLSNIYHGYGRVFPRGNGFLIIDLDVPL